MEKGKAPLKARGAIAALLLLLASCADFDLYSMMQGELPGGTLQISPLNATVSVGKTCKFSASGGSPPYTFSVIPHSGCGSINANSGLYAAPALPTNDTIQVQDKNGATSLAVATVY
jgi:hypothetical protein